MNIFKMFRWYRKWRGGLWIHDWAWRGPFYAVTVEERQEFLAEALAGRVPDVPVQMEDWRKERE